MLLEPSGETEKTGQVWQPALLVEAIAVENVFCSHREQTSEPFTALNFPAGHSTIRARVAPVADAVGHSPAASARIGVAWAGKARVWRGLALEFRVLAGGAQATRCRALPSLVCSRGTEERAIGA